MRTRISQLAHGLILIGCLALAACTSGTTTTAGTNTPTAVPPTAVPTAAKPTSFPVINLAFCQHILSVSEANQDMQPPTPATDVTVGGYTPGQGGSCVYQVGSTVPVASPSQITLTVYLMAWHGPNPIPQSAIQEEISLAVAKQFAAGNVVPNFTLTPVTGIGDQAEFATISANGGPVGKVTIFYVLYGTVLFDCVNYFDVGNSSDAAQMSGLQQCAQTVVSRL